MPSLTLQQQTDLAPELVEHFHDDDAEAESAEEERAAATYCPYCESSPCTTPTRCAELEEAAARADFKRRQAADLAWAHESHDDAHRNPGCPLCVASLRR